MKGKYSGTFNTGWVGILLMILLAVPIFFVGALFILFELVSVKYQAWSKSRKPPCN